MQDLELEQKARTDPTTLDAIYIRNVKIFLKMQEAREFAKIPLPKGLQGLAGYTAAPW